MTHHVLTRTTGTNGAPLHNSSNAGETMTAINGTVIAQVDKKVVATEGTRDGRTPRTHRHTDLEPTTAC